MPQLDPSTYPGQILWLVIAFVFLYFVLRRVALPKVADVLEARQDKIDDDLKKATNLKVEAESVMADYEKAHAKATAAAHEALKSAQESWQGEAKAQNEALSQKLAAQTSEAEARIAAAKAAALGNLNTAVAEVTAAATEKLLGVRIGDAQVKQAVEDVTGSKG